MLFSKIRKKMHYVIWVFVTFFAVSIFYLFGTGQLGSKDGQKGGAKKEVKNIMMVNGRKIPMTAFYYEYNEMRRMYEQYGMPNLNAYSMDMRIRVMTVRQLIMREALLADAKKRGLNVTSGELKKSLRAQQDATVGPADAVADPGLPARVKHYFAANQKNKEFREIIMRRGLTFDMFRKSIESKLLAEKMMSVRGQELQGVENKKVLERANSAFKKLKAGESFPKIAMQYSDDPATKENGGLWGWKTRADLDKELSNRAFAMSPGVFSEPVKTQAGYQIIKLEAREDATGPRYEAERPAILARLQKEAGKKTVTERDIKQAYEKVLLSNITFQLKDANTLVNDWTEQQINLKKIKFDILDLEIKAFWEMQESLSKPKYSQEDLDRIRGLFEKASKSDSSNFNIYSQIGLLYEEKNKLIEDSLKGGKKDKSDPYEKAEGNKPKTTKFLKEALESYKKSYDMAQETKAPELETIMGLARINMAFFRVGGKEAARYRRDAIKYFTEAIDFSYDNVQGLYAIEGALTELKNSKGLKEVREVIADIQRQEMERSGAEGGNAGPYQFDVGDQQKAAETGEAPAAADQQTGTAAPAVPAAAPTAAQPKAATIPGAKTIKAKAPKTVAPAKAPAPAATATGTR